MSIKKTTTVEETHCDNCGAQLEVLFNSHPKDALDIRLSPGYGQYFDSMNGDVQLIFCKTCADDLVKIFPSFAKAIQNHG